MAIAVPITCPPSVITAMRERRRVRHMIRSIADGNWAKVLLAMERTQHRFASIQQHSSKIAELLVKLNLVSEALDWHVAAMCGHPFSMSVPEGYEAQAQALNTITDRCLWDSLCADAIEAMYTDSFAPLRIDVTPDAGGVCIHLDDADTTFPIGGDGCDRQPTAWDRRWIVERQDPSNKNNTKRYLRIERHAPGVIYQMAFACESADILQDESTLKRVELSETGDIAGSLQEVRETGVAFPLIVRLARKITRGEAKGLIRESDIDLIDAFAAAFSRADRISEIHSDPLLRIVPDMVNKETGTVDMSRRAIDDPDKLVEYVLAQFDMESMLNLLDRIFDYMCILLKTPKALLGAKPGGGASPDSYDKLRLESTGLIAMAKATAVRVGPAVARVMTMATVIESRLPISAGAVRGYPTATVSVQVFAEIPKDMVDIVSEQGGMLERGLTSQEAAVIAIHGERRGRVVLEQIRAEEAKKAELAQRSLMTDFGFDGNAAAAVGAAAGAEGDSE